MKCEFSETSYVFSLISELIKTSKLGKIIEAPIAPSTLKEGIEGFDAKLIRRGKPLIFQFKIPEYITKKMASSTSPFPSPFYRIKLWNLDISDQHNILKRLSDKNPGSVYYVAPVFHTLDDFNNAFCNDSICDNSVFLAFNNIPLIKDKNDHHIYYRNSGRYFNAKAFMCSEPVEIASENTKCIIDYINEIEIVDINEYCRKFLHFLGDFTKDLILKNDSQDNLSPYSRVQNILNGLGIALLFIGLK